MQLKADWAAASLGYGDKTVVVPITGLADVDERDHSRFGGLGFEAIPVSTSVDNAPLWKSLKVDWEGQSITITVTRTSDGADIRKAVDLQLVHMAAEVDKLRAKRRSEEDRSRVEAEMYRRSMQKLLDDLKAEPGST